MDLANLAIPYQRLNFNFQLKLKMVPRYVYDLILHGMIVFLVKFSFLLLFFTGIYHLFSFIWRIVIIMPAPRAGALSDDARLTSVCLTSVCRVHRA